MQPANFQNDESSIQSTREAEHNADESRNLNFQSSTVESGFDHGVKAPIIGHEVVEQRSRFTVFKIHVQKSDNNEWFVFRRYSDFSRLHDRLREQFPNFRFALPPKKWFGDNFDVRFIDDRKLGLQAFINNILSHDQVQKSEDVKMFLCLDEPPGAHDSLEESRALCEALEEQMYKLKEELKTKNVEISLLKEELDIVKDDAKALRTALRKQRSSSVNDSISSEHDRKDGSTEMSE
ncbi:unnamed protein product [Dimorphilus gyrociliatus]|uniref:PX domain-containing protein n=1 Tax=Dimorphilus gyrociliatus TaxID=2664684 RepID=A0A7I8VBF7_9ANNE|nr:unnamed protein product [Dimorphilus gyrociliatus]